MPCLLLTRENTPHIIKLRTSCYGRPLTCNNYRVLFSSSSAYISVCPWNNHTGIFQPCSGCPLYCVYFPFYWVHRHARVLENSVTSACSLLCVFLFCFSSRTGLFRGVVSSLKGNVFKTPIYYCTCLTCSFIPLPDGNVTKYIPWS